MCSPNWLINCHRRTFKLTVNLAVILVTKWLITIIYGVHSESSPRFRYYQRLQSEDKNLKQPIRKKKESKSRAVYLISIKPR